MHKPDSPKSADIRTAGQRYALLAIVYSALMIPSYFILHTYMVIGIPLVLLFLTLYLLRNEYEAVSLRDLRGRGLGVWIQVGFVTALLAQIAFHWLLPANHTAASVPYQLMQRYPIMPVYMVLQAPLVEEVIFRKIIFGQLARKLHPIAAALISSVLFGALHNDWSGFVSYFAIGLLFCWLYARSRSIIPSLAAHMALNALFLLNISQFS